MTKPPTADQAYETLLRMNTELLSELWILRDRVAILEKLLDEKGIVPRGAVDDYAPDAAFDAELQRERDRMVRQVVGVPGDRDRSIAELTGKKSDK